MPETVRSAFFAAVALLLTTGPLAAADEPWEQLLKMQLESEFKCVLSGTIYVRELQIDNGTAYSGRAKCYDGREYDFSQSKPHMKFEIRSCDPTVC